MVYSVVGAALRWGGALTLAAWAARGITNLVSSYSSSEPEGSWSYYGGWRFPADKKLKMNTAGRVTNSRLGFGCQVGFGGVIRNDLGYWIIGFYGRLRDCSSTTEAELWGIYMGLQIIQENNWREVEIESDLQSAVELINDGNHAKSPIKEIVEECKVMMLRTGCTLKLIDYKANKVADEMANFGRDQDEDFGTLSNPPYPKIVNFLNGDKDWGWGLGASTFS